jgi:uncharacterized membrane protein (UPF0127 family)
MTQLALLPPSDRVSGWFAASRKPRELELHREDGIIVCKRCRVADAFFSRFIGLLGRRALAEHEGLLLHPASSIHTFFMRFPIDVVFVGPDGAVRKVVRNLRPWRITGSRGSRAVLELPAGTCARLALGPGDRLDIPRSETRGLRVLVAGRDRRYVRFVSFLLAQKGLDVARSITPELLPRLVSQHQPDVVIVEAGTPLSPVGRIAAATAAAYEDVRVVLVVDDARSARRVGVRAIEKKCSLNRLLDEIELAHIGLPPRGARRLTTA